MPKPMKKILLILSLAASTALADDNLLRNSDFSNGISHWEGDCHPLDSGASDLASSAPTTSSVVVVKLRKNDWTKVMQDFEGKTGDYVLTITYSISDDLQFSRNPDDYTNLTNKIQFSMLGMMESDPGNWIVILTDYGAKSSSSTTITPVLTGSDTQSVTTQFHIRYSNNGGLCIAFPPGRGVLTLHSITLAP
jgi:hypothetical protein